MTGGALLGVSIAVAGVSVGTIATVAGTVAALSSVAAQVTAKKPPTMGSATQTIIGANMPTPCLIGRSYSPGQRIHEAGYGGTVAKVKNPYRSMVDIISIGPINSIESVKADFTTIGAYYTGWLSSATQLGACPEAAALAGPYGAIPDWGASHKLSGFAAVLWSLKFDKDNKKFAAGIPMLGTVDEGVLAYDPRLDSTYPGGSGAHRFADETSWAWSENPALHAIAYARGRYQNGKKIFGCGFGAASIDLAAYVELANLCDANGWTVGGTIYEPGSKWANLKRILAAAGAEPMWVGAKLSVRINAPKVALDTITADDLADGEYVVPAMKSRRIGQKGIIPKFRSEDHKWDYVQGDAVVIDEVDSEELQYDLVQDKDQAAQLAAYELVNRREFGPIVLPCKPRMMEYLPGEALEVDVPELGLNGQLCVITGRRIDPATAIVELTLESETSAKHAFALGLTGTAPPVPSITSGQDMDDVVWSNTSQAPQTVASEAAMLALTVRPGTSVTRSDINQTFEYNGGTAGTIADWTLTGVTAGGTAATTPFTPAGTIVATDVQAAIVEVAAEAQPLDAQLTAIAGLTPAADQAIYWTGLSAAAMTSLTASGRTVMGASGVTGTGSVMFSASPTLTGTAAFANITASGTLAVNGSCTIGDAVTDTHTINGAFVMNTGATTLRIDATTGNRGKIRFDTSGVTSGYLGADATRILTVENGSGLIRHSFTDTGATLTSGGTNVLVISSALAAVTGQLTASASIKPGVFTVATVPSAAASGAGAIIHVSNEVGGAITAFSDGANWRRVSDRAVVS